MDTTNRWVLAFDASCGTCSRLSKVIAQATAGKVEVLPLSRREVQRWRKTALGTDAAWKPTLIRVSEQRVRAWTGAPMSARLLRRLGPRSTARVLRAIGQLRHEVRTPPDEHDASRMGRGQFLRRGAGGLGVAAGIVLTGKVPAFATQEATTVRNWIEANRGQLPQAYDDVVSYPMAYRKAIHAELSLPARARLWETQFDRYRQRRPNLTEAQDQLLSQATEMIGSGRKSRPEDDAFRKQAREAFGNDHANALFTILGPDEPSTTRMTAPSCECSTESDWCGFSHYPGHNCLVYPGCDPVSPNWCGTGLQYVCNGICS